MPADATRLRIGIERFATQTMYVARDLTVAHMRADGFVPRGETGELARSIRGHPEVIVAGTRRTFRVSAPVIQAVTTDKGARAHVIRPRRRGGHLVFYWPKVGQTVYLTKVNHPGNRPMPWWRDVVTDAFRIALPQAARQVRPQ